MDTKLTMASFNIKSFEKKLKALDGSQTGIQTLSLWIIHHRHHANLITATWVDFLEKGKRYFFVWVVCVDVHEGRAPARHILAIFISYKFDYLEHGHMYNCKICKICKISI